MNNEVHQEVEDVDATGARLKRPYDPRPFPLIKKNVHRKTIENIEKP